MKRITREMVAAARARAAAQIAGTYQAPPPVKVRGRSPFCGPIRRLPIAECRVALRAKDGGRA